MNTLHPPGLTPAGHAPSWTQIKALLATTLRPALQAAAMCNETECCSFGQARAGGCPCSQDEDALIAADLLNASNKAVRAHRAQELAAVKLERQHAQEVVA